MPSEMEAISDLLAGANDREIDLLNRFSLLLSQRGNIILAAENRRRMEDIRGERAVLESDMAFLMEQSGQAR